MIEFKDQGREAQAITGVRTTDPYRSFWQGGFEGADHLNSAGRPICVNNMTGHLLNAESDYGLLARFGIRTVRESAGWRYVEINDHFNFERIDARVLSAQKRDVQIVWTLMQNGLPQDIDIFDASMPERFARYCSAFAHHLREISSSEHPVFTPIHEISFVAWAICHSNILYPHVANALSDRQKLKRNLASAAIQGCRAIREIFPRALFLHTEPLLRTNQQTGAPPYAVDAVDPLDERFDLWDMICGRLEPELGGDPAFLDIVGVNYYHSRNWSVAADAGSQESDSPDVQPLSAALIEIQRRYEVPVTLADTGHFGVGRTTWIDNLAEEVVIAQMAGAEINGICLCPLIDRPDWEKPREWHRDGLWHVHHEDPSLYRTLNRSYAEALVRAQLLLAPQQESA